MATGQMSEVIQLLRRTALLNDGAAPTDAQLLECYLSRRDEGALAALVHRHAPMVWGVCRRVLLNHHDAEDAFQATFLVFVRRASAIAARELLANWLYGVAHQTSLKARATAARRKERERQVMVMPEPEVVPQDVRDELLPRLDQELSRLPDKYRAVIVLCDLEGKTRQEAARELGCPEGTVAGRLARARVMLAKRLARRGLAVSGGTLAAVLSENAASASVPTSVVGSTIKAANLFAAGHLATGLVSPRVADLTEGVLKTMFLTKLKIATLVLLAAVVAPAGWFTHHALADKPAPVDKPAPDERTKDQTEVIGVVKAVDASRNTLTLHPSKEIPEPKTFTLAADVEVLLDDGTGGRLGFQKGKPADLTEGSAVILRLADQKVIRVWVEGPTVQGVLKSVDARNNTITATVALKKGEPAAEMMFTISKHAKLFIEGQDKSKPSSLADLPVNAVVTLKLSADRKVVGGILAEGQSVTGRVKAVDGAKGTLTVTISIKGEPDVERTFAVAKSAQVSIDDGKLKDKTKPAEAHRLADVPVGAQVTLRLSLDGQSVVSIRAEGSTLHGTVKAVDAVKNTLTLHDKEVEDGKTYSILPDVAVYIDGKGGGEVKKLADVPVGAVVDLKLLADQKSVCVIRAQGPTVMGNVVGNAGNDSITIGGKEGETTYTIAKDARILIEEKRAGKLIELIDGTVAWVKLSADQSMVLELRAKGPSFRGTIKAFDSDKNTITLLVGAKNGEGGEDKEFRLTKDTAVVTEINGVPLERKDLRVDREVVLRLAIDQKAASRITVLGE